MIAGSFCRNGNSVAPGRFLHGDKNVIALCIDSLGQIALDTYALHDIELARALAEEDARCFPWLRQNLRGENFKIDMEYILVGEVDSLNRSHVTIVGHASGFADGERYFWKNVHRVDYECFALPVSDRMSVESWIRNIRMGAAVCIDTTYSVAIGFTEHGDATRRKQNLHCIMGDYPSELPSASVSSAFPPPNPC